MHLDVKKSSIIHVEGLYLQRTRIKESSIKEWNEVNELKAERRILSGVHIGRHRAEVSLGSGIH
jgi:hypothetical protein